MHGNSPNGLLLFRNMDHQTTNKAAILMDLARSRWKGLKYLLLKPNTIRACSCDQIKLEKHAVPTKDWRFRTQKSNEKTKDLFLLNDKWFVDREIKNNWSSIPLNCFIPFFKIINWNFEAILSTFISLFAGINEYGVLISCDCFQERRFVDVVIE